MSPSKLLFFLLASTLLNFGWGELLMEVEFDLAPVQQLANNYSSADAIQSFLSSMDLKWLRYFNILASGEAGSVKMRVAHLMFEDAHSWAQFQQEQLITAQALFDHFWVNARRIIWFSGEPDGVAWPERKRSEGMSAGFVFQLYFTPVPGKRDEMRNEYKKYVGPFLKDLEGNPGFLERSRFTSKGFQSEYEELVQYEFASMPALVESMFGKAAEELNKQMSKFKQSQSVTILTPGADQSFYWQSAGNQAKVQGEL